MKIYHYTNRLSILTSILALAASGSSGQAPNPAPPEDAVVSLNAVVVTASPLERSMGDVTQATSVLVGHPLKLATQPTLGETLANQPGISSTWFGPGASRPVIRGMGGDRIRVLENGVGGIDASNLSPDHAVSIEPLFTERIEVVRGPASLFYGSTAVGGVVNVIDRRLPETPVDRPLTGFAEVRASSAADERTGAIALQGGLPDFSWSAGWFRRNTGDVSIPGFARRDHDNAHDDDDHDDDEEAVAGLIPNSAISSHGGYLGGTYFGGNGFIGLSHSRYDSRYGIPPGGHGEGNEDLDDHDDHDHHDDVLVDLRQRRFDLKSAWFGAGGLVRRVNLDLGYADYRHHELEDDEIETTFETKGYELRLEALHDPIGLLEGAWGLQVNRTALIAEGDEAFLPPVKTRSFALFAYEEVDLSPVVLQGGVRFERTRHRPDVMDVTDRSFSGLSGSLGGIWKFAEGWALVTTVSRTDRIPVAQELYADGPHIATSAFEIGDPDLGKEGSTAWEVSLRKQQGFVTGSVTAFRNSFSRYIFEQETGEIEDGLPVFEFVSRSARFQGWETELFFHLHENAKHNLDLRIMADSVRATNRITGDPLPRISPERTGAGLRWRSEAFNAGIDLLRVSSQNRTAPGEEQTGSHHLLSADLSRTFRAGDVSWDLFFRGTNLTNREARVHTSFLKDVAPLPGQSLTAGLRLSF